MNYLLIFLLFSAALLRVSSFSVPPTSGVLPLNFNFNGRGNTPLVSFDITNCSGTMTIRGETYSTIAYYTQLMGWPPVVRWIDFVGINSNGTDIAVVYLGCNPPMPNHPTKTYTSVWEEDFSNQLKTAKPPNTLCDFTDLSNSSNFNLNVSLPGVSELPSRGISTHTKIYGDGIYLDDDHGWVVVGGVNYTTTPITTVDCSNCGRNCETCPHSPWYELHFIYNASANSYTGDASTDQVGFGIYYIYPYDRTFVSLNYTITFPTLETPRL